MQPSRAGQSGARVTLFGFQRSDGHDAVPLVVPLKSLLPNREPMAVDVLEDQFHGTRQKHP